MKPTRRLLKGLIAGNPGNYAGLGEWRYCHQCEETFFARAGTPESEHSAHRWSSLPALDPEGRSVLADLFRLFIVEVFTPERQAQLGAFARRHGWEMAYELVDGGGALNQTEAATWHQAVERRLEDLVDQAESMLAPA